MTMEMRKVASWAGLCCPCSEGCQSLSRNRFWSRATGPGAHRATHLAGGIAGGPSVEWRPASRSGHTCPWATTPSPSSPTVCDEPHLIPPGRTRTRTTQERLSRRTYRRVPHGGGERGAGSGTTGMPLSPDGPPAPAPRLPGAPGWACIPRCACEPRGRRASPGPSRHRGLPRRSVWLCRRRRRAEEITMRRPWRRRRPRSRRLGGD